MTDWEKRRARMEALHPRVRIGNGTTPLSGKTVWGVILDDRYHEHPRCRSAEGALRKAEKLSREIEGATA